MKTGHEKRNISINKGIPFFMKHLKNGRLNDLKSQKNNNY